MIWKERTPMRAGDWWHLYPVDDDREHNTDGDHCWCKPTIHPKQPTLLVHHALREETPDASE